MQAKLILLIVFTLIAGVSSAQSSRRKKKATSTEQQPNSVDPNNPPVEYQEKKTSSSSGKTTYNAERNYYERMSDLEKERRKNERMMDKPQYSDPLYFGHKHPPKRHKPSKMKYCKVCGIRH